MAFLNINTHEELNGELRKCNYSPFYPDVCVFSILNVLHIGDEVFIYIKNYLQDIASDNSKHDDDIGNIDDIDANNNGDSDNNNKQDTKNDDAG
jgi:hypothetical protein